jgi:hypothetical protein
MHRNSKRPKSVMMVLRIVLWVDWYLVTYIHQVNCEEDSAPSKLISKVGDVTDAVMFFNGSCVQSSAVSTVCSTILFLGDEVERAAQWLLNSFLSFSNMAWYQKHKITCVVTVAAM